jgi:hypothetical protein
MLDVLMLFAAQGNPRVPVGNAIWETSGYRRGPSLLPGPRPARAQCGRSHFRRFRRTLFVTGPVSSHPIIGSIFAFFSIIIDSYHDVGRPDSSCRCDRVDFSRALFSRRIRSLLRCIHIFIYVYLPMCIFDYTSYWLI